MSNITKTVAAAMLGTVCGFSSLQAAPLGAADEPIKLAMLEWSGQHVTSHIAGNLLKKMGYKVEYVTAGNYPQFSGLADGTLSASLEIWMNNVGEIFPKSLAEGKIEDLGSLGLKTKEGWLYTQGTKEACPGLPNWQALNEPACIDALAAPDTFPDGRLLDYPADWGSRAATILQDNAMPYQAIPSGSEGALVSEMVAADAAGTPLLMMFWGPHYALAKVDAEWVEMPPCVSEENAHCINPPDVNKIVWSGFGEQWPAAYEFLKQFQVDAGEQQEMMLKISEEGQDVDVITNAWIKDNEAVWQPWIDAATQ